MYYYTMDEMLDDSPLHYVSDADAGFTRIPKGEGFEYLDENNNPIRDKTQLTRIKELVIPPAWQKVWICPSKNGHIQAVGYDEKGRKQYIYHPLWTELSSQTKFKRLPYFADMLPRIRDHIQNDLRLPGLPDKRVLATVVWLLEHTYCRIGNTEYAKENESYGLTTLRSRHVDVVGDTVRFEFKGKSGVNHAFDVIHPRVVKTIRKLEELPGYELFRFVDDLGNRHKIRSDDVNEYLKEITGQDITAKDFRTWGGTVISAKTLSDKIFQTKKEAKKNIAQAVKDVAKHLRNTPKVCRSYYIHPTVITTYEEKILIPHFENAEKVKDTKPRNITFHEFAVTTLLKKYPFEE